MWLHRNIRWWGDISFSFGHHRLGVLPTCSNNTASRFLKIDSCPLDTSAQGSDFASWKDVKRNEIFMLPQIKMSILAKSPCTSKVVEVYDYMTRYSIAVVWWFHFLRVMCAAHQQREPTFCMMFFPLYNFISKVCKFWLMHSKFCRTRRHVSQGWLRKYDGHCSGLSTTGQGRKA